MKKLEYLIAFSTIASIFTMLRFSIIGIGESLFLILFLLYSLHSPQKDFFKRYFFSKFWIAFIISSLIGFFIEFIYYQGKHSNINQVIFDFFSYLFLIIILYTLERLYYTKKINIERLLLITYWLSSIVLISLFLISFSRPMLFGFPLLYHDFFAPFAENVHQTSSYLVPLPFIALAAYNISQSKLFKSYIILTLPILLIMPLYTGSTKALMGVVIGTGVYIALLIANSLGRKYMPMVLLLYVMIAISLSNHIDYLSYAQKFFEENDGGGARDSLYGQALSLSLGSPIFGYGFGPHISYSGYGDTFSDAHQTILAILLQSGIAGVAAFLAFTYKIMKTLTYNPALFSALVGIMIYALGGDILRRLPLWILLFLIFYTSHSDRFKKSKS